MQQKQGLALISLGVLFFIIFFFWRIHEPKTLSFFSRDTSKLTAKVHEGNMPVKIVISSRNMDLVIKEASIKDGVWETFDDAVSHLESSAYPGDGGNIILYGHNTNSLFGPIRWLSRGDLIEITDEAENVFSYKVDNIVEVNPDNISYVLPGSSEVLTLYTCSGIFDSKRYIVQAKPLTCSDN